MRGTKMSKETPMSFEDRIKDLEEIYLDCLNISPKDRDGWVQGTDLQRVLLAEGGRGWCLAIGLMGRPKYFFEGKTIEEAMQEAKRHLVILRKNLRGI